MIVLLFYFSSVSVRDCVAVVDCDLEAVDLCSPLFTTVCREQFPSSLVFRPPLRQGHKKEVLARIRFCSLAKETKKQGRRIEKADERKVNSPI
ncbi:unnamed protein product [Linum trigynum]|uniref:Secreted protein n=1 Tax=Linum trigynum TaxID=586398 RepID=A0AAV2FAD9_9ROSI